MIFDDNIVMGSRST